MEIRNNKTSVYIHNLKAGEVFTFVDSDSFGRDPYMRLEEIQDEYGNVLRAVNLVDGCPIYTDWKEPVIPCKAYLTIE